jgi:hypothetical protein
MRNEKDEAPDSRFAKRDCDDISLAAYQTTTKSKNLIMLQQSIIRDQPSSNPILHLPIPTLAPLNPNLPNPILNHIARLLDHKPARSNIHAILQLLVLVIPRLKRKRHKAVAKLRRLCIGGARQDGFDALGKRHCAFVVHGYDGAVVGPMSGVK